MIDIRKQENGIAVVTLNRPSKHNAFDEHLIASMTQTFRDIESDDEVRLMVLAAEGKNFSAGADLAWMQRMASYNHDKNLEDAQSLAEMLRTLNFLKKPTLARIQGAAFGGAVGLVSCCDIAVAADNARFCLSEVRIGLIPATISPYVIAAIGERAARRYFLSAEHFSATQALTLGLVSEITSSDKLDECIDSITQQILNNSPTAIKEAKRLIADVANAQITTELINNTSERIARIRTSNDGQEGVTAFLEKRPPTWLNQPPPAEAE